jgi:hypothetical protein
MSGQNDDQLKQAANEAFRQVVSEAGNRSRELVLIYQGMTDEERRNGDLVRYVCDNPRGCHLLTVWKFQGQRYWYTPGYTLSEEIALAETAESARAKRTRDGLRRWEPKAGLLADLVDDDGDGRPRAMAGVDTPGLNCKHVRRNATLSPAHLLDDLKYASTGQVKRIPIGTRLDRR